jgi:hypothetical protein
MAEAQDEVFVAVMGVVLHQMPHDWSIADRHQGLRDVLGILS